MRNVILTLGLSVLLAACGGFNGREDARFDARYTHPISVDPQVVTLQIEAPREKIALSVADKSAIGAFVDTYKARGHGLISISAPSGSPPLATVRRPGSSIRALRMVPRATSAARFSPIPAS